MPKFIPRHDVAPQNAGFRVFESDFEPSVPAEPEKPAEAETVAPAPETVAPEAQ